MTFSPYFSLLVVCAGGASRAGFEGNDLRTASRAVEHSIRQAAHLGVVTLAGVLAQSVGQGDYLLEGPQDGALECVGAKVAADKDTAREIQLTLFAERTDYSVGPGG